MKKAVQICALCLSLMVFSGCSVFGNSGVEIAPYKQVAAENPYELRHYEQMVLVSTSMNTLKEDNRAFSKLFGYISGDNDQDQKIAMTAPVFMDRVEGETQNMSFVLPKDISFEKAAGPTNPQVQLEQITDLTVAVIIFNGRLSQDNITTHQALLEQWIEQKGYTVTGQPKVAGYNPPFTIPAMRRNEVLIPVDIKS